MWARARRPCRQAPPQVRVGQKREHVDVFMMKDADHSESVRCFMFLLQSRVFRDRTRGSIYQHVRRAAHGAALARARAQAGRDVWCLIHWMALQPTRH